MTVRMGGLEPPRLTPPDPKSGAATITPHPRFFRGRKSTLFFDTPNRRRNSLGIRLRTWGIALRGAPLPSVAGGKAPSPMPLQALCIVEGVQGTPPPSGTAGASGRSRHPPLTRNVSTNFYGNDKLLQIKTVILRHEKIKLEET